jgi:hypothetical protein
MARAIRASGKRLRFVCIDHFRGSNDRVHQDLVKRCGGSYRHLFDQHLAAAGVADLVEVIEGDSADSASLFEPCSVDFVFIDAEHTRVAVRRDILAWENRVKPGGVLAGHDYDWTPVREAVSELLPDAVATSVCSWWCGRRSA